MSKTFANRRRGWWVPLGMLAAVTTPAWLVAVRSAWTAEPAIQQSIPVESSAGAASEESPPNADGATHLQTKIIRPAEGDPKWSLTCFCLAKEGRIVAVLNRQEKEAKSEEGTVLSILLDIVGGEASVEAKPVAKAVETKEKASETKEAATSVAEVRILDADGKLLNKWPLDFAAQAVSAGSDNCIYLGGDGVMARFDLSGKQLSRGESPQVAAARKDPKELERRARATLEEQRNQLDEVVKSMEAQMAEIDAKADKDLTDEEKQYKQFKGEYEKQIAQYKKMAAEQKVKPITDKEIAIVSKQLAAQDRRINAIAAGSKYVYTTTRTSKGYGYRVWRTDLEFNNSQQIVDGLSGCCGQMDVQCCDDDLVVAENSRYRVVRYDPEGKKLDAWGKSQRDGVGEGFSGCCNPMNTRPLGDKFYVSESSGLVKLFTREGKFEGNVGLAKVKPGCKSSIIDVSADGNRVYYFDVNNSAICVLERGSPEKPLTR